MTLAKAVSFDAKGATFNVALNFSAICQVEEELDMGFPAVLNSLQQDARFRTLVVLFRAILTKDRPDITSDEAIGLIEDIGPARTAELIAAAVAESPLFKAGPPVKGRSRAKAG